MAANKERTFIMVKPDGVQRGLVGKIIKRFEAKGFKLVAMKFMWVSTNRFSSPTGCRKCPNLTFRNLVADEEKHKIKKTGRLGVIHKPRGNLFSLLIFRSIALINRPRRSCWRSTTLICPPAPSSPDWSTT